MEADSCHLRKGVSLVKEVVIGQNPAVSSIAKGKKPDLSELQATFSDILKNKLQPHPNMPDIPGIYSVSSQPPQTLASLNVKINQDTS